MASGVLAAETVIAAKEKGDFSESSLAIYRQKLEDSFVLKDLKKFQKFSQFLIDNPHMLRDYPDVVVELLRDYFTVSEKPKVQIEKEVLAKFKREIGVFALAKDLYKTWRAMR